MKYTFYVAVIIMLASCEKQNVILNVEDAIIGKWSSVSFEDNLQKFERVKSFGEVYGFEFENNVDMIEWTSGWCGTPPIIFSKLPTTYTLKDSILKFDTWWEAKYKIAKCEGDELLLERIRD